MTKATKPITAMRAVKILYPVATSIPLKPVTTQKKLRLGLTAFVRINLDPNRHCDDDIVESLGKLPEVLEAHFTDGDSDVLVKVATGDTESLKDTLNRIREIDGIFTTHTIVSLTNPIREC